MIRLATPDDNQQLLALTARNGMSGSISLTINRFPDFFALSRLRGENITFVAEDKGRIVGCFSVSKATVWINKSPTDLYYLGDLKVDVSKRGSSCFYRLADAMYNFLKSQDADLLFCTIAKGNTLVSPMLRGRAVFPSFSCLGQFKVLQLLPLRKYHFPGHLTLISAQDNEGLDSYFNRFYHGYQLGKVYSSDQPNDSTFAAYRNGKLVAAISLIDTFPFKQNLVDDAVLWLRAAIRLSKMGKRIFGFPALPSIGEPLRIIYISNFFHLPGEEEALIALIRQAQVETYRSTAHFLSVGFHERDPLYALFRNYPLKVVFDSLGYLCSLHHNDRLVESVTQQISYEDFSLV